MIITISIFYYLYLVAVLVFTIFSLFNIYHLIRFGFLSLTNILIIIIYLAISAVLIFSSIIILLQFDWTTPLIDTNNYNLTQF